MAQKNQPTRASSVFPDQKNHLYHIPENAYQSQFPAAGAATAKNRDDDTPMGAELPPNKNEISHYDASPIT